MPVILGIQFSIFTNTDASTGDARKKAFADDSVCVEKNRWPRERVKYVFVRSVSVDGTDILRNRVFTDFTKRTWNYCRAARDRNRCTRAAPLELTTSVLYPTGAYTYTRYSTIRITATTIIVIRVVRSFDVHGGRRRPPKRRVFDGQTPRATYTHTFRVRIKNNNNNNKKNIRWTSA